MRFAQGAGAWIKAGLSPLEVLKRATMLRQLSPPPKLRCRLTRENSLKRPRWFRERRVLRLLSRFALRNGYCAQDDRLFLDLSAACPERLLFFRELSPRAMATSRSNLALDTPSLSASSAGVFSPKLILIFFGTVIPQLNHPHSRMLLAAFEMTRDNRAPPRPLR